MHYMHLLNVHTDRAESCALVLRTGFGYTGKRMASLFLPAGYMWHLAHAYHVTYIKSLALAFLQSRVGGFVSFKSKACL